MQIVLLVWGGLCVPGALWVFFNLVKDSLKLEDKGNDEHLQYILSFMFLIVCFVVSWPLTLPVGWLYYQVSPTERAKRVIAFAKEKEQE